SDTHHGHPSSIPPPIIIQSHLNQIPQTIFITTIHKHSHRFNNLSLFCDAHHILLIVRTLSDHFCAIKLALFSASPIPLFHAALSGTRSMQVRLFIRRFVILSLLTLVLNSALVPAQTNRYALNEIRRAFELEEQRRADGRRRWQESQRTNTQLQTEQAPR